MKAASSKQAHAIDQRFSGIDYLGVMAKGFCMGMADIIPGISGGTIALLLGVYEDLIEAIKSFNGNFLKALIVWRWRQALELVAWRFLGALVIGILGAIVSLSRIIHWLMVHRPVLLNAFFFGLICASLPIIARIVQRWTAARVVMALASMGATWIVTRMVPVSMPDSLGAIFLCGAIAISAMILPGISGAFILVLLGKYQLILQAVNTRQWGIIFAFIFGVGVGIGSFVRVLSWLFRRYHDATMAVLWGVVAGSLNKIWPWKHTLHRLVTDHGKVVPLKQVNYWPQGGQDEALMAFILMGVGVLMALMLHKPTKPLFST